jgi:hypothetical protein
MTNDPTDLATVRAELLSLTDERVGLTAALRQAEQQRDELRRLLDSDDLGAENLRLQERADRAEATQQTLQLRIEEQSLERERALASLREEFTSSRTWRIGSALVLGLRRTPGAGR